tara:strand:+ start:87382 stop:88506 length:1125 start_codon:yes stop_codon:yes gene_type:complete
MKIFFPKENNSEVRASILPEVAKKFVDLGFEIIIEREIGSSVFFRDQDYLESGAKLIENRKEGISGSDIVCRINKPDKSEISLMRQGSIHISFLDPFNEKHLVEEFAKTQVTSISMELVPRITRAQKMDALSSQANLAGYSAVIEASRTISKSFPMMMTAAGTISPCRVFIVGVGVAGLQAIATAKRLGARVEAFDTRPVVEEQVQSLGAKFIKIDIGETSETKQGYAKELSKDQIEKQQEGMKRICSQSDVVITTAQVFGRPAPRIITTDMVKVMRPGSVIVDMAVGSGGNVEGSKEDEYVFQEGVTIIGMSNLPGEVARDASLVYGNNLFNMITEYWDNEKQELNFDISDEILKGCVLTYEGEIINELITQQ